jgi:hypothetical protein
MPVTDDEVAALRAHLSGDQALYHELYGRLDRSAIRVTYAAFITAVFVEAVDRRFGKNGTAADVISFVADVRSRSDNVANAIDPRAAERLILAILKDEDGEDFDGQTMGQIYIVLLSALISDEQLDDDALDASLESARKRADRWLSQ